MRLYPVETAVLDTALAFGAEKHIRDACARSYGKWDYENTEVLLRDGTYTLWAIVENDKTLKASVVTSFEEYPSGKLVLNIVMAAGVDHALWIDLIEQLEVYAKAMRARGVQAWGRRGWIKRLKSRGYRESAVLLEKEI